MRVFFNIYRNILLVIAVFLALVMILPLVFQVKPYIVLSPSMEPTINTGDVCYIQQYKENEKPEVGSIVAFVLNDNKTMFVHRVVGVEGDTYITQGDANDSVDLYKPTTETIRGKAVFIIPYLGTVVSWAKTPQGLIIMSVVVLISILSSFLDTDEKKEKKKKQKTKKQESEEVNLFTEKYNEVKTENSTGARSLSDLIKERQDVRAEMIKREQEEWTDEILEKEFECIEEDNASNKTIGKDEENNEEIVLFDFDNMSVEEETKKIVEKHSAIALEEHPEDKETSYQEISKIGLNSFSNNDDENEINISDDIFDVSKYAEKYLGEEANGITEDTLLFDEDIKDWSFMVDDEESTAFTERYHKSIVKSVTRKLESESYNDTDNFSPSAIIKRAQDAMKDDLTNEELEIVNILISDQELGNSLSEKIEDENINNIEFDEKNEDKEEFCEDSDIAKKEKEDKTEEAINSDESIEEKEKSESEEESEKLDTLNEKNNKIVELDENLKGGCIYD